MPEPEITLLSVLFLLGAAQAIFFAFSLYTSQLADKTASRYLIFLLLVFALELASEFLDHSRYGLHYIRLMIFIYPTDFLFGPLIWLYTTRMCSATDRLPGFRVWFHFIPQLIFLGVTWRLLFDPLIGTPEFLVENPGLLEPDQIQSWITPAYSSELAILHIALYLGMSIWRLRLHSIAITNVFSYREGVALSWLHRLLIGFSVLLGLFTVRVLIAEKFDQVGLADSLLNLGMVIVIYAMAYFAARQPRIFTRRIGFRPPEPNPLSSEADLPLFDDPPKENDKTAEKCSKYRKSALDDEISARILNKLTRVMQEQRPFLKNNLTLPDLARLVPTTPNYLSQVINQRLQMNFFDFINSYRIEVAKELIINPLPHTRTILDIAMESAFNSKSAFYAAFKKQTGLTPAQFKRNPGQ